MKITKRARDKAEWCRKFLKECPPELSAKLELTYRDSQDIALVLQAGLDRLKQKKGPTP
jgi:hypothetical protein